MISLSVFDETKEAECRRRRELKAFPRVEPEDLAPQAQVDSDRGAEVTGEDVLGHRLAAIRTVHERRLQVILRQGAPRVAHNILLYRSRRNLATSEGVSHGAAKAFLHYEPQFVSVSE